MNEQDRFITVPARAREEIGQLTHYLEQGLRNLRDITEHLHGSSVTMPGVLDDLRDVVRMTETATVRVLEQTEALVDDGRAAARLLADVHAKASAADTETIAEAIAEPMRELGALVERSNARAMDIMSALEFQDLTSQKVQRTFGVLEEVLVRLNKIQQLVAVGEALPPAAAPAVPAGASAPIVDDSKEGQRLADELLLHFAGDADG
jgi:chemotaxis regulatin CheY-phosphate phosphatase CheZ